jgi:uncharacterized damage-inducible protein DinB
MTFKETFLPEFDHEMAVTRRVLERAPVGAFSWRPHEKSWTLGGICTHLAQIPSWGNAILDRDGYDLTADARPPAAEQRTLAEVLETFDTHVAAVRRALLTKTEGELEAVWSLSRGGQVLMSMPKIAALKSFVINHSIHHRGQLTLYLRLQNVPLPPVYGPTADEPL